MPAFACWTELVPALWTAHLSHPYTRNPEEPCTTAWIGTLAQGLFVAAARCPLLSTGCQEAIPKSAACYRTLNLQCSNFTETTRHRAAELLWRNALFPDMHLQKRVEAARAKAMQTVQFYRLAEGLVTLKTKWASEACSLYLSRHFLIVLLLEPPRQLLVRELQLFLLLLLLLLLLPLLVLKQLLLAAAIHGALYLRRPHWWGGVRTLPRPLWRWWQRQACHWRLFRRQRLTSMPAHLLIKIKEKRQMLPSLGARHRHILFAWLTPA